MQTIDYWIKKLDLKIHPEGGYYSETFRSDEESYWIYGSQKNARNYFSVIYYLLPGNQFSSFHRLKSDETWFFHEGCPIQIIEIGNNTNKIITLGGNPDQGESFQYLVSKGTWFAAKPVSHDLYSLVSCVVVPGFDFSDFQMGERKQLIYDFPEHRDLILRYTR